jgi:hypothetical protein
MMNDQDGKSALDLATNENIRNMIREHIAAAPEREVNIIMYHKALYFISLVSVLIMCC